MQPTEAPAGGSSRTLKRYGPLIAIVAVIAIVGGIFAFSGGSDDDGGDDGGDEEAGGAEVSDDLPEGVIPFSAREEFDLTDEDFGERCDPETGRQAYPSPFAGACMAPFEGDNGGETATGVTADTIKIVYYRSPDVDPIIDYITGAIDADNTNAEAMDTMENLVTFFETYAETYGRHVELELYEGTGPSDDEVAARADAVAIAQDMQPFMVWGGPQLTNAFADELAAQEVPCIGCVAGNQSSDWYIERAPYNISITANNEQSAVHLANFLGRQVAGRPAEFAGDEDLQEQERVFGLVSLATGPEAADQVEYLEGELANQDIELAAQETYDSPITLQTTASNVIAQLKEAGVTSVLFSGDPIAPQVLTQEATAQDYFPEWIITGSVLTDTAAFGRTYDQEQWSHAFGVTSLAARIDPDVSGYRYLYNWFTGEDPAADRQIATIAPFPNTFYNILQGTGPDLTAESFRDALFRGEPSSRDAVTQPSLSWGDQGIWPYDDYLGIDDYTLIWWDPDAEGQDETGDEDAGLYRFVDGGERYLPDEWPEQELHVFDPEDTVTIYDERPPEEGVPDYPSPAGG
jgi:hypothetical protein